MGVMPVTRLARPGVGLLLHDTDGFYVQHFWEHCGQAEEWNCPALP